MGNFDYINNNDAAFCGKPWDRLFFAVIFIFLTSCGPSPQYLSGRVDEAAEGAIRAAISDLSMEANSERNLALINRLQSDIPDRCIRSEAALVCQSQNIIKFQHKNGASAEWVIVSLMLFNEGSYCRSEMRLVEDAGVLAEHEIFSINRVTAGGAKLIEIVGRSETLRLAGTTHRFLNTCKGSK